MDYVPRELEAQQIESLKVLARQVVELIELRTNLSKLETIEFNRQQKHKNRQQFFQKVAVGLGLTFLILAGAGFFAHRSLNEKVKNSSEQSGRNKIIDNLEDINLQMKEVAIAKHRYINSPQLKYLEPYYSNKSSVKQEIAQIRLQIADNPAQQKRLASLERLIDQKLT